MHSSYCNLFAAVPSYQYQFCFVGAIPVLPITVSFGAQARLAIKSYPDRFLVKEWGSSDPLRLQVKTLCHLPFPGREWHICQCTAYLPANDQGKQIGLSSCLAMTWNEENLLILVPSSIWQELCTAPELPSLCSAFILSGLSWQLSLFWGDSSLENAVALRLFCDKVSWCLLLQG